MSFVSEQSRHGPTGVQSFQSAQGVTVQQASPAQNQQRTSSQAERVDRSCAY